MLQAILLEPGRIEIREIETPHPSDGEVLIKVKNALTCGTDLKAFLRGHPLIPMPGPFGHEFSGIIAEKGKGVRNFREGDEIMAVHSAPCMKCPYCEKGLYNLCNNIMKTKVLGAFSEYLLLPSHIVRRNLFHKPQGLGFEEAAFLEPLSCVVHGMRSIKPKKGDTVLIIGAGPIGLLHLLLLKKRGLRVIITARRMEKLELARRLGADQAVEAVKLKDAINDFTGGSGVDVVIECTGQIEVWKASIEYVRRGGTIILFGGVKTGTEVCYDTRRLHYDEITIKGVFHFTPEDVKWAAEVLKTGLKVSWLITDRVPLMEISSAFERLSRGEGIKYAIIT